MYDTDAAAICMGVSVPFSPFLSETRRKRMDEATYEGEEITGALAVVRPGDRVLEIGSGLGVVGAVVALNREPAHVLSFEANPDLVPHIRALYERNGLEGRMTLRNEILLSRPDRPAHATFHRQTSFLGSSLFQREAHPSLPVEVPTADFNALCRDFRPDVLLMDIEGAELELLEHADLTGIRAIVIEFHPAVYGKAGAVRCKTILRQAGFRKDDALSTRTVWTCARKERRLEPPRPDGGWSGEILSVERPVVVPPEARSHVQKTGVLNDDGEVIPHATLWRGSRLLTEAPALPDPDSIRPLPGKWLWGGTLWRNFAHFITESVSRLWALDALDLSEFDGILFVPKNPRSTEEAPGFQSAFLGLMGCTLPVFEAREPVRPDLLVVPGQSFGLGAISAGTRPFRETMNRRFGAGIAPDGPERLYVSRSRLGSLRGGLLGEDFLERKLEEQGYQVFHPQEHTLDVQIARYRAARQIIAAEGSALHLIAHAARPGTEVAMIQRRRTTESEHIARHLEGFLGCKPTCIHRPLRTWRRTDTPRVRMHVMEPDFDRVRHDLQDAGFIGDTPAWGRPRERGILKRLGPKYALLDDSPAAG